MRSEDLEVVDHLLHVLDQRGWDTTVDELARAAGISRATFFRIYGSKEDLVFADHAVLLERLERLLAECTHDVASTMRTGLMLVFRYHLEDESRTLARHRLLKQSTQLRNRELLTSHHYERIFRSWLRTRLDGTTESPEPLAISLAGAAVALHNAFLRRWLSHPSPGLLDEFNQEARRLIQALLQGYGATDGTALSSGQGPVAVVTLLGQQADTEEVCEAVRRALTTPTPQVS